MEPGTVRDDDEEAADVDAYWRRRVVVLGGVLAVVGVMVWACSGSGGKPVNKAVTNAAAVTSPSASASPSATLSATPGAVAAAGALPTVTVTATAQVTVVPTPAKRAGDACDPHDVVVALVPTKDTYAKKEHAQFRLSVVNTGGRACTFGVGPKELEVLITSGSDKVWTSARCYGGSGSSIQLLQRGIPYGGTVDWDRRRTAPAGDCSAHRATALPGTYGIVAKSADLTTKRAVFHLR